MDLVDTRDCVQCVLHDVVGSCSRILQCQYLIQFQLLTPTSDTIIVDKTVTPDVCQLYYVLVL